MKKYRFKFDEYEIGIMINCMLEMRNKLIREGRGTDALDELIIKITKKNLCSI